MTAERWETVRQGHSYPTKSGSTHFISYDMKNIFHVVRGVLRCCTEGTRSTCPGTYGGRFHNGHGAIAVRYLLDQQLNLAFRFIAVRPPPRVTTTADKLRRFLRYGKMVVRSVVPPSHHIHPMWTDPSLFRQFQVDRAKSVSQYQASHPAQISGAYLPLPEWNEETGADYRALLNTPHEIWSVSYLGQCSNGAHTGGIPTVARQDPIGFVGAGYPNVDGGTFWGIGAVLSEKDWMLQPPLDGQVVHGDGVVPAGYRFIFPFFGEPVAVVPPFVPEPDTSGTMANINSSFYRIIFVNINVPFC